MPANELSSFVGAMTRRKNALRKLPFAELIALPSFTRSSLACRDAIGLLGVHRRRLPDGTVLIILRCEWSSPVVPRLVHYLGFVKSLDGSWSEQRPEIFDEQIRLDVDQNLASV